MLLSRAQRALATTPRAGRRGRARNPSRDDRCKAMTSAPNTIAVLAPDASGGARADLACSVPT
jgi:hypothetical protein